MRSLLIAITLYETMICLWLVARHKGHFKFLYPASIKDETIKLIDMNIVITLFVLCASSIYKLFHGLDNEAFIYSDLPVRASIAWLLTLVALMFKLNVRHDK